MMYSPKKNNSGFIALLSVVVISFILLLIVTNLSLVGFYSRANILDSELKERSNTLAEACVDQALLKLANNASYVPSPVFNFATQTGGEVVTIGSDNCTIQEVAGSVIKVQGIFDGKYFTNLEIRFNPLDLSVIRWEEKSINS